MRSQPTGLPPNKVLNRIVAAARRGAAGEPHLSVPVGGDTGWPVRQVVPWLVSTVALDVRPNWRDVFAEAVYVVTRLSTDSPVYGGLVLDVRGWLEHLSASADAPTRHAAIAVDHALDVFSPGAENGLPPAEACAHWSARAVTCPEGFLRRLTDLCDSVGTNGAERGGQDRRQGPVAMRRAG